MDDGWSREPRKRVYVACPISNGDVNRDREVLDANFQKAITVFDQLWEMGLAPLCPAFTVKHPRWERVPYNTWTEIDAPWVLASHAVFRIPGESKGADEECQLALDAGIPVFTDFDSIRSYFGLGAAMVSTSHAVASYRKR
jgi:hypothetical protein